MNKQRWQVLLQACKQLDIGEIYATGLELIVIGLTKFGWLLSAVVGLIYYFRKDDDCAGFFGLAIIWLVIVGYISLRKKRGEKKLSVPQTLNKGGYWLKTQVTKDTQGKGG